MALRIAPYVASPRPNLPRTIGSLNVILGGMLFLCGLRCLNVMAPSLTTLQTLKLETDSLEHARDQVVADLEASEPTAKDAKERQRIRSDRGTLESGRVESELDLPAINDRLRWLSYYFWLDVATGPILNLLMLASGLGLLRLMGWARSLGIWVAIAKLIRIVVLFILMVVFVIPQATSAVELLTKNEFGRALVTRVLERQNKEQGMPQSAPPSGELFAQSARVGGYLWAILALGFGAVYPIVSLVVLLNPGARAACEEHDDDDGTGLDILDH